MTADDWRAIADGWVANLRADIASRRGRIVRSLASLKHRDSEFAKGHERMIHIYDRMLRAIDEPDHTQGGMTMTEYQIECSVETMTNALDLQFMAGHCDEVEYKKRLSDIDKWAEKERQFLTVEPD